MASSQFTIDSSGKATITGPLTLNTVTSLYEQAKADADRGRQFVNLDLDAVPSVDSSGLALLLELQATAVRAGNSLHIRNAPADLLSLVSLCEAGDLLAIDGRNQEVAEHTESSQNEQDHHS
jgi:ABC-type transporter Mla MlaB component